jgi:hypothetical protein
MAIFNSKLFVYQRVPFVLYLELFWAVQQIHSGWAFGTAWADGAGYNPDQ